VPRPPIIETPKQIATLFIENAEGLDYGELDPRDRRPSQLASVLKRWLPIRGNEVLGAGSFGVAVAVGVDLVLKITKDQSEVEAGAALVDKTLPHVVRIDGAWFVSGMRVDDHKVGVLIMERVNPLEENLRKPLSELVMGYKANHDMNQWDMEGQGLDRDQIRERLYESSIELEHVLLSRRQHPPGMYVLYTDVAAALAELRKHDVYAIDVHGGNVGWVPAIPDRIYKVFDIGASSTPRGPEPGEIAPTPPRTRARTKLVTSLPLAPFGTRVEELVPDDSAHELAYAGSVQDGIPQDNPLTNRFPAPCSVCGTRVAAGTGQLRGPPWVTTCHPCLSKARGETAGTAAPGRAPALAPAPDQPGRIKITLEPNGTEAFLHPEGRLGDFFQAYRAATAGARYDKPRGGQIATIDRLPAILDALHNAHFILDVDQGTQEKVQALTRSMKADVAAAGARAEQVDAWLHERGKALYEYQREGVAWLAQRHRALLGDQPGLGKAQPIDEPVLTPEGWKTIGTIVVGDTVIGADGRPTRVTGIFPQGSKPIYRVALSDGAWTRCCAEHLWLVQTHEDRTRGLVGRILSAAEIIQKGPMSGGRRRFFVPMMRPAQMPTRELSLHPYLLGALIANGGFCQNSPTHSGSQEQRDAFRKYLPSGVELRPVSAEHPSDYRICGDRPGQPNALLNMLRAVKLYGLESHERFVPTEYMFASIEQRIALLQGLCDNDGTVSKDGLVVEYNTTSPQLAADTIAIIRSLGGSAWMSTRIPTFTVNGERREGRLDHRVRMALPDGIEPFRVAPKLNRYKPRTKYPAAHAIESVEPIGEAECVCIKVEADDHLYVTRDFIVTHNTVQTLAALPDRAPVVVVCPKVAKGVWQREASQWRPDYRVTVLKGHESFRWPASGEIVIVNYAILPGVYDKKTKKVTFESEAPQGTVIIYDESHALKDSAAQQTKKARKISDTVLEHDGRVYLLSVAGDSMVLVRDDTNGTRHLAIDRLHAEWENDASLPRLVRAFDGQRFVWSPLTNVIAHPPGGVPFYEIATTYGRRLGVTANHSVYRVEPTGRPCRRRFIPELKCVRGDELQEGDFLLLETGADPIAPARDTIDIAPIVSTQREYFVDKDVVAPKAIVGTNRAHASEVTVVAVRAERKAGRGTRYISRKLGITRGMAKSILMPGYGDGPRIENRPEWRACRSNHLPARYLSRSDLAFLVGYFVGDGWVDKGGRRVSFAVAHDDLTWWTERTKDLFESLGARPIVRMMPRRSVEVRVGSVVLCDLLSALGCCAPAHAKRLPAKLAWDGDLGEVTQLLSGLEASDGYRRPADEHMSERIYYTTVSKLLAEDLVALLRRVGVVASVTITEPMPGGIVDGKQIQGRHRRYTINWNDCAQIGRRGSGHYPTCFVRAAFDGLPVRVKSVRRVKSPETVYDLEVAGSNNFIANGLLVHNSGTPMKNSPPELYSVLQAADLARDAFGSYNEFVRLFNGRKTRFGMDWGQPRPEVGERMKRVMLRRLKQDVLKDLPPKQYGQIPVEIDAETARAADEVIAMLTSQGVDLDAAIEQAINTRSGVGFEMMSRVRAMLATAKIGAMIAIIEEAEHNEEPLLVFSAHRAPIDLLSQRPGWATITGDTPAAERTRIENDFQAGRYLGVAATIAAAGVAITLTRASHEIFVDRAWSPSDNEQAEDRAHRHGQTRGLLVQTLVAEHALDERVHELLMQKQKLIAGAIETAVRREGEVPIGVPEIDFALLHLEAEREIAQHVQAVKIAHQSGQPPPPPKFRPPKDAREEWAASALRQLAALDPDMAMTQNMVGFNKLDGSLGHSLASQLTTRGGLTDKQWALAIKLVAKYHRQVGSMPEASP
jgi:intein/homing endonuclease